MPKASTSVQLPIVLGSLWMLVAGVFFSGMGVFVKLGTPYFSSFEMVFYRSLLGAAIIAVAVRRNRWEIYSVHWKTHIWRSLAGFSGMMLLFHVIGVLPLSTATTLNYTSPLFLVLLSSLVLKEKLRPRMLAAVVLGFSGVVLLLRPTLDANQTISGLLGLASGFFAGVAFLTTKHLGQQGEPAWRIVFYFSLVCTAGSALFALADGFHAIHWHGFVILIGLGVCAVLGQLCMTRAYREGNTLTVGSLAYSTVVFTTLLSLMLWNDPVPLSGWLAICLIVVSGIAAAHLSNSH